MNELDQRDDAALTAWPLDWGRLLRTARQVAGLSLTELSLATGISKGHLSKLESGHPTAANPSRATLAALARALPSFRPLANTLEPSAAVGSLIFGAEVAELPPETSLDAEAEPQRPSVLLGWRELEIVMALLALEASASPAPLSALLLARAVGRKAGDIQSILGRLVAMGIVVECAPHVQGAATTYRRAPEFEQRTGIMRIGDALVLAAGLLAQTTSPKRTG